MNKIIYTIGIFAILFMVLSPGFLINLPPYKNRFKGRYIFFTGASTFPSVIVHSLVFSSLAYLVLTKYTLVESVIEEAASTLVPLVSQIATPTATN